MTAESLPGEVLERVLAHVLFPERVMAAAVCRAWRQYLSQAGLLLWQAASIWDHDQWEHDLAGRLLPFLPLQRWLWHHGGGLRQVECNTAFNGRGMPEDSLLTVFLTTLAASAPSLQALRLDGWAARALIDSSMIGITSMGSRLRQLVIHGVEHVPDNSIMMTLAHLPLLQDLAIMFADEREAQASAPDYPYDADSAYEPPEFERLLSHISDACPALRTLALGHLPSLSSFQSWAESTAETVRLPASMSRLRALSSLTLHHFFWYFDSPEDSLPHLPQLRRLSIRAALTDEGPEFRHQLSTLTALEALQASLSHWPCRLPLGLTHLVLSLLGTPATEADALDTSCVMSFQMFLPPLRELRHLALHGLRETNDTLQHLSTVIGALPHLISLHMVDCNLTTVPTELCKLSRLQLLNLAQNAALHHNGLCKLAEAPLQKLAACRLLDLRHPFNQYQQSSLLLPDAIRSLASMPALERLALPLVDGGRSQPATPEELAQLAQHRAPHLPPLRVATEMPESDEWGAVNTDLNFGEVNEMLGTQLDRSISRGVVLDHY